MLLLSRCVISLAGTHLEILLEGSDFDGAIAAIRFEISRMIRNYVLAPELIFDGGKRILDIFHLVGKESPPAGGVGNALQNFIASQDQAAVIGRDGVNNDLRTLRHFNGL